MKPELDRSVLLRKLEGMRNTTCAVLEGRISSPGDLYLAAVKCGIVDDDSKTPLDRPTFRHFDKYEFTELLEAKIGVCEREVKMSTGGTQWTGNKKDFALMVSKEYRVHPKNFRNARDCCYAVFARFNFPKYPTWEREQAYELLKKCKNS